MGIQTINPTTEEVLETFEPYSQEQSSRSGHFVCQSGHPKRQDRIVFYLR